MGISFIIKPLSFLQTKVFLCPRCLLQMFVFFSLIDEQTDFLGVTQSGAKWIVTIGQMLLTSLAVVVVQKGLGVLCYAKKGWEYYLIAKSVLSESGLLLLAECCYRLLVTLP